ncbi:MAG: polymer-forming cytoskeletal protein [Gammaproteobacteria bacterium]|nr:polymer-forming cytoskeletal protein [Gammaproteobacteria bacterium]
MKKFRAPKVSTIVGQGTVLNGDLVFRGGLHLDGTVKGDIAAEDGEEVTLTVSEKGEVIGDVRVTHMILNGSVVGDVYVTGRVELAPQARVTGSLYYNLLEMAMGAEVNGQLIHTDGEPKKLEYTSDEAKS